MASLFNWFFGPKESDSKRIHSSISNRKDTSNQTSNQINSSTFSSTSSSNFSNDESSYPISSPKRRSKRKRYETASLVLSSQKGKFLLGSYQKSERRQITPETIQPNLKKKDIIPANAFQPFTRTDRLRKRRKLELKRSGQVNEMDMKEEEMADDLDSDNPLHGYMDIITMDRIVTPAISPEGQVMGKASWLKCLKEYGRCPITHKQIHPEELVVLTRTNFHKFNKLHRITKRLRKYEE